MAGQALPRWTHTPIYAFARAAIAAFQIFPVEQNLRTMRSVGEAIATAPWNRKRVQRAVDNLAWCFPEWSPERVNDAAVEAYRRLFALAIEMAYTPRLITRDGWTDRVRLGHFGPALESLIRGGPTLLITGHCGNWEVLGYTLAELGFPMHALYRPLDLKPLDRWVRETRAGAGLELLDKFGAGHRLPEILKKGEPVAFIADQNAGDRGIFVPFFNRLASAYKSIGLMAIRYDTPIICGGARSVPRWSGEGSPYPTVPGADFHYEIDVTDVIYPEDWKSHEDPLFYITARYRRAIEMMVRRAPQQYLWMHRYWKSRPSFEMEGKPFPPRLREKILSLPWTTPESLARLEEQSARDSEAARAGR